MRPACAGIPAASISVRRKRRCCDVLRPETWALYRLKIDAVSFQICSAIKRLVVGFVGSLEAEAESRTIV